MDREYTLSEDEKQELIYRLTKQLRTMRLLCGLSQTDLAEMIGVTRQTILILENGKREMTWTMFLALFFVFSGNHMTRKMLVESNILCRELYSFLGIERLFGMY